jgi:biopolymer transport protein ExbB/TolQ
MTLTYAIRTLFILGGPPMWTLIAWLLYDLYRIARRSSHGKR